MKLTFLTDIHLNFINKKELLAFMDKVAGEEPDALMVSGDIAEATSIIEYLGVLGALGVPVYFVLGNHDYYYGQIGEVRADMEELTSDRDNNLFYLPDTGIVELDVDTCLIGVDGWGDGRYGDPYSSRSPFMADWSLIKNFEQHKTGKWEVNKDTLLSHLEKLGDAEAAKAHSLLIDALEEYNYSKIVFLTHVPPWIEATWHDNKHSNIHWQPWFTCKAVGDVLVDVMLAHPDRHMDVYCGHTHGEGRSQIAPNIVAYTGGARYHHPEVQKSLYFGIDEEDWCISCEEAPIVEGGELCQKCLKS